MKKLIEAKVYELFEKAGVPKIDIKFDAEGVVAGQFVYSTSGYLYLNFNLDLAERNQEEFMGRTVPHEVAHYVRYVRNGYKVDRFPKGGRDIHGKKWKAVMQELGVNDIATYHSYDVSHVKKRRQRRWEYVCSCVTDGNGNVVPSSHSDACSRRVHYISTVLHNRIIKGETRHCKSCKGSIEYTGQQIK